MDTNLILISGGGFSTESDSYIDEFALSLCSNRNKKKCVIFLPTASHDSEGYIEQFSKAFDEHENYYITEDNLMNDKRIDNADLIYIGGGDPNHLVQTWKKVGFDKKIIDLYQKGHVIAGISAGAMCWFDYIYENNKISSGLNVLEGSFYPHYDEMNSERNGYEEWAEFHPEIVQYKLNNNESLHVQNEKIVAKIISWK